MRFLNTKSFELENFSHDDVPRQYAILSHSWGKEEDEIRFRDVQEGRIKEAHNRPTKLEGCCKIARDDGYEYIWVDTCCIDNINSVELQEAINSMFRWYKNAAICYAFLSDVPADDRNPWDPNSKFSSSRWFERGWTLQELLAPPRLRFYNCEWHYLGTKGDLCAIVEKATRIPSPHLLGIKALRDASVAQRMSWAAKRVTKKPEDIAYSLLGLFGVAMPMIYGEGSQKAFTRLQELIMKEIGDDSILAWGLGQTESTSEPLAESPAGCILASSPADFVECGHIQAREHATRDSFDKFGGSLRLHVPLFISPPGDVFGLLKCGDADRVVGIPLVNISNGASDKYIRPQGRHPMLVPKPEAEISPTTILVRDEHENRKIAASSRKYWFNVQGSVEIGLELIDVEPRSCWRKEEALIEAALTFREDSKQRIFVRFRCKEEEAHDFLVVLELRIKDYQSDLDARCNVMTCARDASLEDVAGKYSLIRPEAMDRQSASNGTINLQVILEAVQEGTMYFLRAVPLSSPPEITYDATVELQILSANMEMILLQEEESTTEKEATKLRDEIQETENNLNQTTAELELVKRELSEIEAKKARLVVRLEEGREEVGHLNHSQKATMKRLDSLAKRRSSTQRCLESFSTKALLTNLKGDGNAEFKADSSPPSLNWAAENGHLGVVRRLLDMGVVNIELKSGSNDNTPLHLAARYGHHAIAILLLDHGANIDSRDRFDETPLFDAVQNENEEVIQLLVEKGAEINVRNNYGETPLFGAVRSKDEQTISLLVGKGANINVQSNDDRLSLHLAVKYGVDFAVKLFLEKGVNIEAADNHLRTALHEAAEFKRYSTTEILLKNRAAVNAMSIFRQSPLHLAVAHGDEAISTLLINSGANVDARDNLTMTPLHLACQKGFLAVAELLIREGANINTMTCNYDTPLHIAAENERVNIVELLVKKEALMVINQNGLSPLHWAASTGNEAILKTLCKNTSVIHMNHLASSGKSPLDLALENKHESAAKLLLSHGVVGSSKNDNNGVTVQPVERGSIPFVAINVPTHRRTISQAGELISSRTAVPSPRDGAGQNSLVALKQRKSPTTNLFDKVLKRRKAT